MAGTATVKQTLVQVENIELAGVHLVADPSGTLYWPAERLLCVADLHFEKGSSFARYGQFLPPYDTCATLVRLRDVIARYEPRTVIALGGSFHDGDGPGRLPDDDRHTLRALQHGRDWVWIAGNHDPDPAAEIGGRFCAQVRMGSFVFRHEPSAENGQTEIAGHLHPMARVSTRGRAVSRKCFVSNGQRMVMPAFGAFTGGLNVRSLPFDAVFGETEFLAHLLGDTRLYTVAGSRCLPD